MASYNGKGQFVLPRPLRFKDGINPETITTNITLTYYSSQFQLLRNNTSSLDVILPAFKDGAYFWVKNRASSTSNIVVKDEDGNTIATLAAGEGALFVSTSTAWWDVIQG